MQTYRCTCGNRLFFENTTCLACQAEVGWCEHCRRITTLELGEPNPQGGHDYRCSHSDCRTELRKCHNYAVENICNRLFPVSHGERTGVTAQPRRDSGATPPPSPTPLPEGAGVIPAEALCLACQLTETIPDLNVDGNREKWARLEAAKRRLLYTLDRLALPYADAEPRLAFDFKADVEPPPNDWRDAGPVEIVYTGHADGKITINIREADDAEREKLRVIFREAHRTLIGHFHHEVGHYYWQLLVQNHREREREFVKVFGDHNQPPYADAMAAYYDQGPPADWPQSFISAYAAAHPWEDFAETFALYLDMVAVLDTASHLFKSLKANFRGRSVKSLVERYQEIGILENEFNRTMGLIDLVPEVIAAPVVAKLEWIHKIVKNAAKPRRERAPGDASAGAPVPMLMQQGPLPPAFPQFEPAILVGESA